MDGRIAAIADVFDALTTDRVYRKAFDPAEAVRIMRGQSDPVRRSTSRLLLRDAGRSVANQESLRRQRERAHESRGVVATVAPLLIGGPRHAL